MKFLQLTKSFFEQHHKKSGEKTNKGVEQSSPKNRQRKVIGHRWFNHRGVQNLLAIH